MNIVEESISVSQGPIPPCHPSVRVEAPCSARHFNDLYQSHLVSLCVLSKHLLSADLWHQLRASNTLQTQDVGDGTRTLKSDLNLNLVLLPSSCMTFGKCKCPPK